MYMISFKIINSENKDEIYEALAESFDKEGREALFEIVESLPLFELEDVEYAITASHGCLLMRIFDMGRYLFLFPIPLSEEFDLRAAVFAIAEYSKIQEIPLTFSDVPISDFYAFSGFSHFDCDLEDEQSEAYRVKVKSECELLEEIPEVIHPRVTLNALAEGDIPHYASLNRDASVSKFWGYDYKDDNPDASDEYFFLEAQRELSVGTALSLAVRADECFIGEAVIFSFDRCGGAEFAVRLLPEAQGRGLGRAAMLALFDVAREIGLKRLYAKICKQNLPSCAMAASEMEQIGKTENENVYAVWL